LTSYYLGASKIIAKLLSKYTAKEMFISLWMVVAHDDLISITIFNCAMKQIWSYGETPHYCIGVILLILYGWRTLGKSL